MMKRLVLAGIGALAIVTTVGAANAADISRRQAMPTKAVPYVQAYNWTGGYIGINGGGGWGRSDTSAPFASGGFRTSGGILGGTLGYNYQMGQTVFGVEGDIDWSNIRGSATCGAGFSCSDGGTCGSGITWAREGASKGSVFILLNGITPRPPS